MTYVSSPWSWKMLVLPVVFVAGLLFMVPSPTSAIQCAYNSNQGSCACPTSGPGVTCVGGQLYNPATQSCYNDVRPCAANQVMNCDNGSCQCNTSAYPCGGCTAPTSTPGANCSSPTGGKYSNQCGSCSCPSGTQLCSASNTCVTTLSCPQGTTFDPCTNSCGTPNVLLSPAWDQSGNIRITGDITSTTGDLHLATGKSISVNGAGTTLLNIGNWAGTDVNLKVFGDVIGTGISTIAGDVSVGADTVETSILCFGNGVNCRSAWPTSADFNADFVNASGTEAMTGPLTINGSGTNFILGGGGSSGPKMRIVAPTGMEGMRIVSSSNADPLVIRNSTDTTNLFVVDETGTLTTGAIPWARLSTFPSACPVGQYVRAVGGSLTCVALPTYIGGSGTASYVPRFTNGTTLGNSQIYDNGSRVGVGTTSPDTTHKLEVSSTGVSTLVNRDVSVTNASQWVETMRLTSTSSIANNFGPSFTFSVAGNGIGPYNIASITATRQGADNVGDLRFSAGSPLTPRLVIGSNGDIGINDTTPDYDLDVEGRGYFNYSGSYVGAVTGNNPSSSGYGVRGDSTYVGVRGIGGSIGVYGTGDSYGVSGYASAGRGGSFSTDSGIGVYGLANNYAGAIALYGQALNASGYSLYTTGGTARFDSPVVISDTVGISGTGDDIRFHTQRANDTSYEWLGFYSGSTRQGIMIWDGDWDGCSSNSQLCLKSEIGDLGLKASGGDVRVLSNLNVTNAITSNYWDSWWTVSASNGASGGPWTMVTASDRLCALVKTKTTGSGGECRAYISGGNWYRTVSANSSSTIACEWYCFKYK